MSHDDPGVQAGSVFSAAFLDLLDRTDVHDPLTVASQGEADTAGPWSLRKREDGEWEVVAEGRAPAAVVGSNDLALLVAAAIPALSRQLVELGEPPEAEGSESARTLIAVDSEEEIGYLDTLFPETLASYVNLLEYLRRSPLDLARLLYAARGSSLRRAGAILWLWEQAPR
jgi:hypothetical protein